MKRIKFFNIYFLFFLLSLSLIITSELVKKILNLDELIIYYLSERMSSEKLKNYLEFQPKWKFIEFLIFPILILIKTILISSIIYISVFFHIPKAIKFKIILKAVLKAEFIFLLIPFFKIIWFYFIETNYSLEDIQYFYPFSALNLIGYKGLETYFIYPFQVINLFELSYVLLLGYYIGKSVYIPQNKENSMDFGLKIVASSYIPALFLWVTIVMFFTLNYS